MSAVTNTSAPPTQPSNGDEVARLERAIKAVAGWIVKYEVGEAVPRLKYLQAERDRLLKEGDPIEYAKRVLADAD
jgi:hypothetical protein